VEPGIVIPLVLLPLVIIGIWVVYRRSLARLQPDDARPVSGVRLTAESLHRLDAATWRVVYEIGGALGGVDHVVIGPPGVIAIATVAADRPPPERLLDTTGEAALVSEGAVARGPVDELGRPVGVGCDLTGRVFWGSPDTSRPPFDVVVHGVHLVEGQRIAAWLDDLATRTEHPLDRTRIDLAWQAITMGIGRPDPLSSSP
jgi:hypothetical protein